MFRFVAAENSVKNVLRTSHGVSQRRYTPVLGSPSPSNRNSSHENVHGKPMVAKQDLPGVCKNQLILQELSELSHLYNMSYLSYASKVIEREMLEGKVAGM